MSTVELLALAKMIADGQTKAEICPHCGPNQIVLSKAGKLISCQAFYDYLHSGRTNGAGCLFLHHGATKQGCPFEKSNRLACSN